MNRSLDQRTTQAGIFRSHGSRARRRAAIPVLDVGSSRANKAAWRSLRHRLRVPNPTCIHPYPPDILRRPIFARFCGVRTTNSPKQSHPGPG